MKTKTITHVPRDEVVSLLANMAEEKGTQAAAAKELGITKQELSNTMSGTHNPPRKVLDRFQLEARTIYVRKTK